MSDLRLAVAVHELWTRAGWTSLPAHPRELDAQTLALLADLPDNDWRRERLHYDGQYLAEMPGIIADLVCLGLASMTPDGKVELVERKHR